MPAGVIIGALVGGLFSLAGCAPSLSGFEPAHTAAAGHVRATWGADVSIPTGTLARAIDGAKTLTNAAQTRQLSQDEKIQLIAAGLNIALNPPAVLSHLSGSYAWAKGWEARLRLGSGEFRLGGRRQLLAQQEDGWDLTLGLDIGRLQLGFPVDKVVDLVRVEDFSRWTAHVPLVIGRHSDFYRIWAAPRLVYTRYSAAIAVGAPGNGGAVASEDVASASGSGLYLAGQAGAAFGYRFIFVAIELTMAKMVGEAALDVFARQVATSTDTWIIYPAVALMGEF